MNNDWNTYRDKIIGLGETSLRKSYYPELQEKISELEISRENLQTIFNSTSDSIIIHDYQGKILSLNIQAERFLNIKENEVERYSIYDVSSPKQNVEALSDIWSEVLSKGQKTLEWLILPLGASSEVPVQVSLNNTRWYGKAAIVAVVRDFSERKKFENELIIAKRKAEESDHLKSVFLANLSHEIRTPMNAILGFSGLLRNNSLPETTRENYINIIHKSGNHLLSIINDIIEISKIETNQVEPHLSEVDINMLMDELYQLFYISSLENSIDFKLYKSNNDPYFQIITDEVKLKQIVTNLLSNSFKFTEKGSIEFGYTEENQSLTFWVKDTGIGISKENFSLIFERFRQVDNDISVYKGGSGLGLAISKAYVEMLGGTIEVKSELNSGTEFTFTIPKKIIAKPSASPVDTKHEDIHISSDVSILIAEDDDMNFLFLSEALSSFNYRILRAINGREVLEILSENSQVEIILMDIKMPVMNGFDSFKALKLKFPQIPVIAQTAYALPEDEERIRSAGFDGFISKPIDHNQLINLISTFLK